MKIMNYLSTKSGMRLLVIVFLLLLITYFVWWFCFTEKTLKNLLTGFLPEAIGIGLTFLFIQILLDRAKKKNDLESIAWDILHQADYIIWVWLGGTRVFFFDELNDLLEKVTSKDKLSHETQNLIMAFGNNAATIIDTNYQILESNPNLQASLEEFSNLAGIRDNDKTKTPKIIADHFIKGISLLDKVIKIRKDNKVDIKKTEKYRVSTIEKQIWRHTGIRKKYRSSNKSTS